MRPAGRYGIDAPWVPWWWTGMAALFVLFAVLGGTVWGAPPVVVVLVAVVAAAAAAGAALYWHTSLRGKFVIWTRLLRAVPDGTARVLDLGCGRGAVSVLVARRFPGAEVTGVDLWRDVDQSGNGPDAFAANTAANGVGDRVHAVTGDMTDLPFEDGRFDLVTANVAIHNVPTAAGRAAAVREAWRVLAPGGTLLVVDIMQAREYVHVLRELGADAPEPGSAGWRMWWTGPWLASRVVRTTR